MPVTLVMVLSPVLKIIPVLAELLLAAAESTPTLLANTVVAIDVSTENFPVMTLLPGLVGSERLIFVAGTFEPAFATSVKLVFFALSSTTSARLTR